MIVFGPYDADLNGAPTYWRDGNWRPRNLTHSDNLSQPSTGSIPSIPFDKCKMVHEYDARFTATPLPSDQGWTYTGTPGKFTHETGLGAVKFQFVAGETGYFTKESASGALSANLQFVVAYARFMVNQNSGVAFDGGLDFQVVGSNASNVYAGMQTVWDTQFRYKQLNTFWKETDTTLPVDQIDGVWHRMALDANLDGGTDNAKTIGSIDDLVNFDARNWFSTTPWPGFMALRGRFGKYDSTGPLTGRIRNFVASGPGRFIRAWFRGVAPASSVKVRLFVTADTAAAAGNAVFRVRYATTSMGGNPYAIPVNFVEKTHGFSGTNFNSVREIFVTFSGVVANEPLWLTVERVWDHASDTLDSTVHLLQMIVEANT